MTDPLARDDGEPEPELDLVSEASGAGLRSMGSGADLEADAAAGEEAALPPVSREKPRGAALRRRLLARATARSRPATEVADDLGQIEASEAEQQPEADDEASGSDLDAIGREPSMELFADDAELDEQPLPQTGPPSAPLPLRSRRQLSPSMLAVFGSLLGLATVASIIALVLQLDPRRRVPAAAPGVETSASATPAPEAAAAPHVQRRVRQKLPGPWRVADAKDDASLRLVEGKVGLLPFLRAVEESGVKHVEAYRVLKSLESIVNLDKCDKSDRFTALVEKSSGRVKAFEYTASDEDVYQAREGSDGMLVGKKLDLKVARNTVDGVLVYEGDFDQSAQRWGFDPGLAKVVARAIDGHFGIDELERGDRVRVIAQEVTVLGDFARYSGIEAVEVVYSDPKQKPLRLYYFQGPQSRGYFDDKGRQPFEGGWRKPIKDAPITSRFNPKRMHPILHKIMPHNGIDFGAPAGTPVGASTFGKVSFIGSAGPSGNLVKVEHSTGVVTGYAHLSRFAEGLKVGDHVKRLQLVGYVGSTGRSTGPHLHFSAEKDDKFFDPETLNLDGMRTLPKEERELFLQVKQKYDRLLDAIQLPDAPAREAPKAAPSASAAPVAIENEPSSPTEAPAAAGSAAPTPSGSPPRPSNAVYLSDKELMKLQSATDEGEVEE